MIAPLVAAVIAALLFLVPLSTLADTVVVTKAVPSNASELTTEQLTTEQLKTEERALSDGPDRLDELSDTQLTRLAADWGALDDVERTELIQETRERMQPQASAVAPVAIPSTERRRYGRLVRQPDGTVVRSVVEIQTRVRVQGEDRRRAFGMGFERRHNGASQRPQEPSPNSVISVRDIPGPGIPSDPRQR